MKERLRWVNSPWEKVGYLDLVKCPTKCAKGQWSELTRKQQRQLVENCEEYLKEQLDIYTPRIIIPYGADVGRWFKRWLKLDEESVETFEDAKSTPKQQRGRFTVRASKARRSQQAGDIVDPEQTSETPRTRSLKKALSIPLKIFVSSKIKGELEEERKLARQVIDDDLKQEAVMWEKLPPAMAKSSEDAYLEGVRNSQVYVGIIGAKYSPGSFDEFQEALSKGKKPLIFVKDVPDREPKEFEFLENTKKFKHANYSKAAEFPSKLKDSIVALIAEEALAQMQMKGVAQADYAQSYRNEYVRPLFEETNVVMQILREKRFEQLPTHAWLESRKSIHLGIDQQLDEEVQSLYKSVSEFNSLRILAFENFKQLARETVQAVLPRDSNRTDVDQVLERLTDHAALFVIVRQQNEDWWTAYDNVKKDVEIPLNNINKSVSVALRPSDVVDPILGAIRRQLLEAPVMQRRTYIGEYNDGFDKLLAPTATLLNRLREVYSGRS